MQSMGFSVDEDKQYSMAVQDVSLEFARQMKNERLDDLDADKLIAFRIFNVNAQFIEELRGAGLKISDSDKLVAFRIHGVTPQMVQDAPRSRLFTRRGHPDRNAHSRRHPGMGG